LNYLERKLMPILKYCGITNEKDYRLVLASRATHIGFIFAKGSKRYVEPKAVSEWIAEFGTANKRLVGVFVNESTDLVINTILHVPLDVIQLHGEETVEHILELKKKGKMEIWKAIPHNKQTIRKMEEFAGAADAFLIDSKVKGQFGGTGKTFNWGSIPLYQTTAKSLGVPCIIAGGIDVHNIRHLLSRYIDGIDISSGIEEDGQKNAEKIKMLERKMFHDISCTR
jgi:phosphoribosylanthranilate isomerase